MADLIPQDFIDDLLQRTDLAALINARIDLKPRGQNHWACCPFHHEHTASFSVNNHKQFYYCFGCGAHGNAINFLMEYDRLDFISAIQTLAQQAGVDIPHSDPKQQALEETLRSHTRVLEKATRFYEQNLRHATNAIQYLKNRQLTGEIAKRFRLGYAPNGWHNLQTLFSPEEQNLLTENGLLIRKGDNCYDRFRDRIMFPIRDTRGQVIAFGGRILEQGEPKYLNSPETLLFHKNKTLYGLYELKQQHATRAPILVVEGYMDVISLYQHGITHAVATLGTATNPKHLQILYHYTDEIIFCFDGDRAGREAANRALITNLGVMRSDKTIKFLFLPEGDDPDSFIQKQGQEKFLALMNNAATFSDYFFDYLKSRHPLEHLENRARFAEEALSHLAKMPDGIFKDLLREQLEKIVKINTAELPSSSPTLSNTTMPPKTAGKTIPGPIKHLLRMLLHQPTLAYQLHLPTDAELTHTPLKRLNHMIKLINTHNIESFSQLYQQWPEQDRSTLAELASWSPPAPMNLEEELPLAWEKVLQLIREHKITNLLTQVQRNQANDEQKALLQTLLREKALSTQKDLD